MPKKGHHCTAEHRRNISIAQSGVPRPHKGHPVSEETRQKIILKQKGISKPQCGRAGHIVSEETKAKIRQSKLGKSWKADHDIILRELAFTAREKFAITNGLIPDAIFIEDGKLVALEVEKKRWETDIKRKMKNYDKRGDYDKVIIVWYSLEGERLKEWHKERGEWTLFQRG
jgi:hypothetical protein